MEVVFRGERLGEFSFGQVGTDKEGIHASGTAVDQGVATAREKRFERLEGGAYPIIDLIPDMRIVARHGSRGFRRNQRIVLGADHARGDRADFFRHIIVVAIEIDGKEIDLSG